MLTINQTVDKLDNDYDDYNDNDDDVRDPDNEGDNESDVDMYESDEEEEGVNLDVVTRQEQPWRRFRSTVHGSSH
jgi:hypothetical protein